MADLTSLIERIEAATEGSRELDRIVALLMGWRRVDPRIDRCRDGWIAPPDDSPVLFREVPPYTTSIDTTRSIDPTALCVFASDIGADGLPMVKVVPDTSTSPVVEYTGIAATLELAWCAAILRARQTEAPHDES